MTASVVLAHPYEKSFNYGIYARVLETLKRSGAKVYRHNLHQDGFNPVLTCEELGAKASKDPLVNRYVAEMTASDLLIFIHPNWWGQPPAILKGYVDRVIRPPHAYDFPVGDSGVGLPIGKLAGKTGLVFNTSNTKEGRENQYFGDPLQNIWERCIFGFCGITESRRRMFRIVADSTAEQRATWLDQVEADVLGALA